MTVAPEVELADQDRSEAIDAKLLLLWRVRSGAVVASIAVAVGAGALVASSPVSAALAVASFVPVAVIAMWFAKLQWQAIRFVVGPETLEIRSGVLLQRTSLVPYHRVQHVDLETGPIERRLDIASLQLRTASASTDSKVPGLPTARAVELRETVLRRIGRGDAV